MKKILAVAAILTMTACAGRRKPEPFMTVSGDKGEVLRIQESGKVIWKARRDDAARVMVGLILQRDNDLRAANAALAACKAPSKAKK